MGRHIIDEIHCLTYGTDRKKDRNQGQRLDDGTERKKSRIRLHVHMTFMQPGGVMPEDVLCMYLYAVCVMYVQCKFDVCSAQGRQRALVHTLFLAGQLWWRR